MQINVVLPNVLAAPSKCKIAAQPFRTKGRKK